MIKLNVGGKSFLTTEATLLARGGNFFSLLLSGRVGATKTEDGAYFIDRDGACFGVLLNFLRTGVLLLPPNVLPTAVRIEADFYQLQLPVTTEVAGDEKPEQFFMATYSGGSSWDEHYWACPLGAQS